MSSITPSAAHRNGTSRFLHAILALIPHLLSVFVRRATTFSFVGEGHDPNRVANLLDHRWVTGELCPDACARFHHARNQASPSQKGRSHETRRNVLLLPDRSESIRRISTITSSAFESLDRIWSSGDPKKEAEDYPFRVNTKPDLVLPKVNTPCRTHRPPDDPCREVAGGELDAGVSRQCPRNRRG